MVKPNKFTRKNKKYGGTKETDEKEYDNCKQWARDNNQNGNATPLDKLCEMLKPNNNNPVSFEESKQNYLKFMDKYFNEPAVVEDIYKRLNSKNFCILHTITFYINVQWKLFKETKKSYAFWIYSHQGRKNEQFIPFNALIYNRNEIDKCESNIYAIPLSLQLSAGFISFGHANMLIVQKKDGKLIVEHFEPHGRGFASFDPDKSPEIEFMKKMIEDLAYQLYADPTRDNGDTHFTKDGLELIIKHPSDLCPYNLKIQQLTSGSKKWAGTCTTYAMWYAFLRLQKPEQSAEDIYRYMNAYLTKPGVDPGDIIETIVKSFVDLVSIDQKTKKTSTGRKIGNISLHDKDVNKEMEKRLKKIQQNKIKPIPPPKPNQTPPEYENCKQWATENGDGTSDSLDKLCELLNPNNNNTVSQEESKQNYLNFMDLYFNNDSVLEDIYKRLNSKNFCILHNIECVIEKVKPYHSFYINSHVGQTTKADWIPFNAEKYTDDQINKCESNIYAIVLTLRFNNDNKSSAHANMLIVQKKDGKLIVEHFEPHGKRFMYSLTTHFMDGSLNKIIKKMIEDLAYQLYADPTKDQKGKHYTKDGLEIIVKYSSELCPYNVKLQELTSGSKKWAGTCTTFAMWYAFLRLQQPEKSAEDIYRYMNDYLTKPGVKAEYIIETIVKSFVDLVSIDPINKKIISTGRPIIIKNKQEEEYQKRLILNQENISIPQPSQTLQPRPIQTLQQPRPNPYPIQTLQQPRPNPYPSQPRPNPYPIQKPQPKPSPIQTSQPKPEKTIQTPQAKPSPIQTSQPKPEKTIQTPQTKPEKTIQTTSPSPSQTTSPSPSQTTSPKTSQTTPPSQIIHCRQRTI
jgi:hypothetical protein